MRVLVTGSRNFQDADAVAWALERCGATTIIHGNCDRGADALAARWAAEAGVEVLPYPADWEQQGAAAGPIRNEHMVKDSQPDLGLVFPSMLPGNRGTLSCLAWLIEKRVPVVIVWSKGEQWVLRRSTKRAQKSRG